MAKGKKSSSGSYQSKGERPNVNRTTLNGTRRLVKGENPLVDLGNQLKAYYNGQPISKKTLLTMGPRSSNEVGLFHRLRKAVQGKRKPMDINRAIKETE